MIISTIHGPMDDSGLEKREGVDENDTERAAWTEYWMGGELVHRSVHMHLKVGIFADAIHADFGG